MAAAAANAPTTSATGAADAIEVVTASPAKITALKSEGEAAIERRASVAAQYDAATAKVAAAAEASADAKIAAAEAAVAAAAAKVAAAEAAAAAAEPVATVTSPPAPQPPPPASPTVAPSVPPVSAPPSPSSAGAIVPVLDLPAPIVTALQSADLLVPSELPAEEQEDLLGAIGFGTVAARSPEPHPNSAHGAARMQGTTRSSTCAHLSPAAPHAGTALPSAYL